MYLCAFDDDIFLRIESRKVNLHIKFNLYKSKHFCVDWGVVVRAIVYIKPIVFWGNLLCFLYKFWHWKYDYWFHIFFDFSFIRSLLWVLASRSLGTALKSVDKFVTLGLLLALTFAVVRSVFFFQISVGKDILFCNFWIEHWLVRIANVYSR